MRIPLLTALTAAVVACSPQEPPSAEPAQGEPPAAAAATPDLAPAAGAAERLAFVDETGEPRLLLDCLAGDPAALRVTVASFQRIDSEDRLTLGAGDEAFALAADLKAAEPGVTASGAVELDLLRRVGDGGPVSAVYGAQRVGPLTTAPGVAPDSFVIRCRQLAED